MSITADESERACLRTPTPSPIRAQGAPITDVRMAFQTRQAQSGGAVTHVPYRFSLWSVIMSKQCQACGHPFTPRPQSPNQKYYTNSECQRERRRRWKQQARQGDSDYRDNDIRTRKTWAADNPAYWKRYRDGNPAYVERNRNLQQRRNQKQRTTVIVNEDVSHALITPSSGRLRFCW